MEPGKSGRAREFKKKTFKTQEERRRAVLERQQSARRNLTDHARMLALGELEASSFLEEEQAEVHEEAEEPVQMDTVSKRKQRRRRGGEASTKKQLRDFYARQLCIPEWMTEVPDDLNGSRSAQGQGWYVRCRPEGKRCLLIAARGRTLSRMQHGEILHKFQSGLPNGGSTSGSSDECTILDAIFHEEDQTYYVLDIMCWKDYSLYDCTAEFRFYWLGTKLSEVDVGETFDWNRYRIVPVEFYDCNEEGLEWAYTGPTPFVKDGLLFYHKQGHYALGLTTLVLLWKDARTTRYLVYSDRQTIALQIRSARPRLWLKTSDSQEVSIDEDEFSGTAENLSEEVELESDASIGEDDANSNSGLEDVAVPQYNLCTLDGCVLGTMTKGDLKTSGVKPGNILRFSISSASYVQDEISGDMLPSVSDAQFEKRCSVNRPVADSWSKILFQSMLRDEPVGFEAIHSVACSMHAPEVDESEGLVSLAGADESQAASLLQKHPNRMLGPTRGKPKSKREPISVVDTDREEPVGEQTMEIPDAEYKSNFAEPF